MLARRWKAPSKATLDVLRDLAYVTSVFTVGTVTVLHLLDLSRRTDELCRKAARAHRLEMLKASMRAPRNDGLSHIDAFILDRLNDQPAEFDYVDLRSPQARTQRRRRRPSPSAASSCPAPAPAPALDLAAPQSAADGQISREWRSGLPNRPCVWDGPISPRFVTSPRLVPFPRLVPSPWSVGRQNRAGQPPAAASAHRHIATSAIPAQSFPPSFLSADLTETDHEAYRVLENVGLSVVELECLARLRLALASARPWEAVMAVRDSVRSIEFKSAAGLWFSSAMLDYLYQLSRPPSNFGAVVSFPVPLGRRVRKSPAKMAFAVFQYLFITNPGRTAQFPSGLTDAVLDRILAWLSEHQPVPFSTFQAILIWLSDTDRLPASTRDRVYFLLVSSAGRLVDARNVYAWFDRHLFSKLSHSEKTAHIAAIVRWGIANGHSDRTFLWLFCRRLEPSTIADVWAISTGTVLLRLMGKGQASAAREIFFANKFLVRTANASSAAIATVRALFLQSVEVAGDLPTSRISLHTLLTLAHLDDDPTAVAEYVDLLRQAGLENDLYDFLVGLRLHPNTPFSSHLLLQFRLMAAARNVPIMAVARQFVRFAKHSASEAALFDVLAEITPEEPVSKELLSEVLSALASVTFSTTSLDAFLRVMGWPVEPSTAAELSTHVCQMMYQLWSATSDPALLCRLFDGVQPFFGHGQLHREVVNIFCLLLLRSDQPELCFRLLSVPGLGLDTQALCLITIAASRSGRWDVLETVFQSNTADMKALWSEHSFYGNQIVESYLSNFGLDRGLVLIDDMKARFQFKPTRRTVYTLAAHAFSESRLDVLGRIVRVVEAKGPVEIAKAVAPISAAVTRQWFKIHKPSSRAVEKIIRGIHQLDPHFATFHLQEIWNWAYSRYTTSSRLFSFISDDRKQVTLTSLAEFKPDLDSRDRRLQPLFQTRQVDELDPPCDVASLQARRSAAVIQINQASKANAHTDVVNLFYNNIPIGVHTSGPTCRQLSIACGHLDAAGDQTFAFIRRTLDSRGIRFPLGTDEIRQIEAATTAEQVEMIVLSYYKSAVIQKRRRSRYPVECSVAAAGAIRMIKMMVPQHAIHLLREYYRLIEPKVPNQRFLYVYIRACRLVGDYRGVIWAISQAIQLSTQLDNHLFLQQVYLAACQTKYSHVEYFSYFFPPSASPDLSPSSQPDSTLDLTGCSDGSDGYSDPVLSQDDDHDDAFPPLSVHQDLQFHPDRHVRFAQPSLQSTTNGERRSLIKHLQSLKSQVFRLAVDRKQAADGMVDGLLDLLGRLYISAPATSRKADQTCDVGTMAWSSPDSSYSSDQDDVPSKQAITHISNPTTGTTNLSASQPPNPTVRNTTPITFYNV